jgi:hypothetical protein
MRQERTSLPLLLVPLLLIAAEWCSPLGALETPPAKMLVMKGKVTFPGTDSPLASEPVFVVDRFGRVRGELPAGTVGALEALGRQLPSGIYFLVPRKDEWRIHADGGDDVISDTGDIDRDGDTDLVIARYLEPSLVLVNHGGTFVDESERLPDVSGFASDVEMADVNGDSALDLFFTFADEQNRLFINDGAGHFGDSTATHLPGDSSTSQAASWGDIDGDKDNDLFVVNMGDIYSPPTEEDVLLINDGKGHFTDETHARFLFTPRKDLSWDALVFDAEGDHDMDLVVINDNFNGDRSRIFINDGTGRFTDETESRFPAVMGSSWRVAAGDLDRDTKADLYVANYFWELNYLWMNDGTGRFYDETLLRTPYSSPNDSAFSAGCDMADVENDSDLDIVVGNTAVDSTIWPEYIGRGQNRLLVNDGFGFFTDRTDDVFAAVEDTTVDVDFLDADGDEYIDLYVTNTRQADALMNDPGLDLGVGGREPGSPPLPSSFSLLQNYPNPFNPVTTIGFTVPGTDKGTCRVSLVIYDLKGRAVRRLLACELPAGFHRVVWDGRDDRGMKVASGVYFARMNVAGEKKSIKMNVLK